VAESATPRLSVVIPTFNRAGVVPGCLRALAAQTLDRDAFEVTVVDDGSRDDTPAVCASLGAALPGFRLLRQQNRGPAAARNAGLRVARGRVVVFTDDDCEPPADWLARIDRAFANDPALVGLGGIMITPPRQWVPLSHHSDLTEPGAADYSRFIGTNNAAYLRAELLAAGGFDETFRHVSVEDAELFIRMRRRGRTVVDPYLYVLHPPRDMRFGEAVRGYVRFYDGYVALQRAYPDEFREIYGGVSPESAVLRGRSWGQRIRRYLPGLLRHPWKGLQFVVYLAASRAMVALRFARRRGTAQA
jgi:glycosyltransferase involved in cell wall biosynthesis